MKKINKAMKKLGEIIPPKPKKSRVSPSIAAGLSLSGYPLVSPSYPDSYSISPSESFSFSISPSEAFIPGRAYLAKGKLGKAGLTGPLVKKKQEPLPSPLERPKRKFKFDEEE